MRQFATVAVLSIFCLASSLGCRERDAISRYRVPKQKQASANAQQEMLVALTEREGQVYFFKSVGPIDQIQPREEEVRQFLRTLQFPAQGPPTWKIPQGWSEQRESGMRLATLTMGNAERPLKLVISSLRQTNPHWQAYLTSNLNRWRGQMGLSPINGEAVRQAFETLSVGKQTIYLARIVGSEAPHVPSAQRDFNRPNRLSTGFDTKNVSGVPPPGWDAGPVRGMRKAAFRLERGGETLEVTVIPAGGPLLANVNRWRAQIGLAPITEEQLQKSAIEIKAGDVNGQYIELFGPSEAILAAIFPAEAGGSWFVKMRGDRTLAEKETATFKTFVHSLHFGPRFQ